MPYESKSQQGYMHEHVGQGSITPAVVKEFDDATKGSYGSLPEHVDGPGGTHHGQLATHHAKMGAHYKAIGKPKIGELHKQLGMAHAEVAQSEPAPRSPIASRTEAIARKRGVLPKPPPSPSAAPPPID